MDGFGSPSSESSDYFVCGEDIFYGPLRMLGADREIDVMLQALEAATAPAIARSLAEHLLRNIFSDESRQSRANLGWPSQRGWIGTSSPDSSQLALGSLFKLLLYKIFLFLPPLEDETGRSARRPGRPQEGRLLGLTGPQPELPAQLSSTQVRVLRAIAAKPELWQFQTNLWELFRLPTSAPALNAFVDTRS